MYASYPIRMILISEEWRIMSPAISFTSIFCPLHRWSQPCSAQRR
ncbi:hypothetical protein EVA_13383 [gut metagenome]|uniref:Uncharacterized protein n=1 Tax=gut metagenome TaxID=749906 RepID=J9FU57_9ZZZZ